MTSWQIVKVGNRTIRAKDHSVEIIVALRSETTGAVLKERDRMRVVSRTIPAACPLAPAELQVLRLLSDGLTYKQIAEKRYRAVSTIRTQLHSVYGKLGVLDRAQAILKAVEEGWL
jgi:DNA-binding NarL/FixJ family response regulator